MLHSFGKSEDGSVLTEFAVTLPLFLIMLFAVIDFGQIYLHWILAEKATHLAARLAVVRPPVCDGVPVRNRRAAGAPRNVAFGTGCTEIPGLCADPGTIECTGSDALGDTFDEIINVIGPLLPSDAGPDDIRFSYSFANLGFLGGPYVPLVTVELGEGVEVPFVTPLGLLLQVFYGGSGDGLASPSMPSMRATLPGEDLNVGGAG